MNSSSKEWLKIAEYDLNTAQAMLDSGRYLYVVFMCQQAAEKILKAIYADRKNEIPPRTHNLLYLVDIAGVKLTEGNCLLLSELNQFYLRSRYPDQQDQLTQAIDITKAKHYLTQTREVWACLKQILTSTK